jgi:hypothetical protein
MEMLKKVLALTVAVVVAWYALKVVLGLLGFVFSLLTGVLSIVGLALIAVPVYGYLRNRLLN